MKNFKLAYCFIFAFAATSAFAQINQTPLHSNGNQIYTTADEKLKTEGSMYFDEKYMPAKISGSDEVLLLRYNAYLDQFEINIPAEQTEAVIAKEAGKDITFVGSGDTYTYVQYKTEDNEVVNGYLKVISNGTKVKVFKSEKIYLQEGKPAKNSYQSAKAPVLKHANEEFYVSLSSAKANFFDGKKDFSKLIPGKEKEVLDYIKKNKIDMEEDADLQKLSTYVETLI